MKVKVYLLQLALPLYLCWIASSAPVVAQAIARASISSTNNKYDKKQDDAQSNTVLLSQVLKQLEKKYEVKFLYRLDAVKHQRVRVPSLSAKNLKQILEDILKQAGLSFEQLDATHYSVYRDISIAPIESRGTETDSRAKSPDVAPLPNSDLLIQSGAAVAFRVSGLVTGENGTGLPGVTVLLKGTTTGTATNAEGRYSLDVPTENGTLVFSFIGYITQEVAISGRTSIDITLTPDVKALGEVVVVGYGTQKKASVTGAISTVSAKEIAIQPVINVTQALQGRVAGVSVVNTGAPGEAPTVRIRGIGTINNANPLYVVDGFPTSDLNSFDPKDIESVEVLKDASAAAIYGSRAANGVILITTRKGRNQKLTVNLESYVGAETAWRKLDLLNREQYIAYANDLQTNADLFRAETDPTVVIGSSIPTRIVTGLDQPIYPGTSQTFGQTETDWQDEMFRTGTIQQHRIDLSGGNDVSRVYASAGYFQQDGIMLGSGYQRGNFRINSDHTISKRFTFGQNLYLAYDDRNVEPGTEGGRPQIQHILGSQPYLPVYNPANLGGFAGATGDDGSDPENPVRIAWMNRQNQQRFKLLTNAYVDVKLADWLTYRFQTGVDLVTYVQRRHTPAFTTGSGGKHNSAFAGIAQDRYTAVSPIITNQLSFDKTFDKHRVNAILVAERQDAVFSSIAGGGELEDNEVQEPSGLLRVNFSGSRSKSVLISYISRVNYSFADKYLVSASFRRDGSSKFAPGNKWGNFPAVSVGWRIGEEAFLRNVPFLSELKLRGSYGLTGNNNIGSDYAFQSVVSQNQFYEFDRTGGTLTKGATIRALANKDLSWETTEMRNIGMDLGLFNNSVTFTAEAFRNTTQNMILRTPIPFSLGYDTPPIANSGSIQNQGLEFQLGYTKSAGDFRWDISGNMSFIQNKVISLGDSGATISGGEWLAENLTLTEAGQPIAYFKGFVTDGIYQNQAEIDAANTAADGSKFQPNARPGDIRFKDLNNDGKLDNNDTRKLGHFMPTFSYGINLSANWKGLDATIFLQGIHGNEIYSVTKYSLEGMARLFNAGTAVLDRWTFEGQNTDVPRAVAGDPNGNARASDRFIEDGSYLRIKNFTVGYSLPEGLLQSFTMGYLSKIRVYFTSQNLLTLTGYRSGYDPEIASRYGSSLQNGIDFGQYPQPRSLIVGLQVGF